MEEMYMPSDKIRSCVIIAGKVQGVCFRMETKRVADGFNVCGWVRNNGDGTVEAVFEGAMSDVASVVEWCKKGPPYSRVVRVDVEQDSYSGEFEGFDIRFG